MEMDEHELMDDEEMPEGVTEDDLKRALKGVRGKKIILKLKHKLKKNLRARSKNKSLGEMEAHLESKGIAVNKESLRQRVKKRRSIGELEGNQDKKATGVMKSDDAEDKDAMVEDDRRGRKRKRSVSSDSDDYMDVDQVGGKNKSAEGKTGKKARSFTPQQLKVRAQSKLRSMSQNRREGSVPQRHPSRIEPEEHTRLAKKINKRFKHTVNVNETDRIITAKKPKHLFAGKRGNGKNERR